MKRSLFKKSTEIDLRENFDSFVFGKNASTPHNHLVLLRKRKLDSNNKEIKCNCVNTISYEANAERNCEFCLGEGFLWTETFYRCY